VREDARGGDLTLLYCGADFAELGRKAFAQTGKGRDDEHGNEAGQQRVLDRGCARIVFDESANDTHD